MSQGSAELDAAWPGLRNASRPVQVLIATGFWRVHFARVHHARETEALNDSGHLSHKRSTDGLAYDFIDAVAVLSNDRLSYRAGYLCRSLPHLARYENENTTPAGSKPKVTSNPIFRSLFFFFVYLDLPFDTLCCFPFLGSAAPGRIESMDLDRFNRG